MAEDATGRERRRLRGAGSGATALTVALVIALACVLLAGIGYWQARRTVSNLSDRLANQIPLVETVTIRTDRPTVVRQVQGLSRLETSRFVLEKIIDAERTRRYVPGFLAGEKMIFVAHGEIVAGLDLSKISEDDVEVSGDTITLDLPAPEILYSRIDNDKSYVYERDTGAFSDPDKDLESQVRAEAEQQLRQDALEDGILEDARQSGEKSLQVLLMSMGYKEIKFK